MDSTCSVIQRPDCKQEREGTQWEVVRKDQAASCSHPTEVGLFSAPAPRRWSAAPRLSPGVPLTRRTWPLNSRTWLFLNL